MINYLFILAFGFMCAGLGGFCIYYSLKANGRLRSDLEYKREEHDDYQ